MSHRSTPAPSTAGLLDDLNLAMAPKPFKTSKSLSRRSKSKKQMVQLERDAVLGVALGKKGRKSNAKPGPGSTPRSSVVLERPGKPRLAGAAAVRANMKAAREARLAQQQAKEVAEGATDVDASMPDADFNLVPEEREATPASTSVAEDENGTPTPDAEPERPKDTTQCVSAAAPPPPPFAYECSTN